MTENVPNIEQFKQAYKAIVHELVQTRNQAKLNQAEISDLIKVDRRKIISLEAAEKIDIQTLLLYADKLSIDIKLTFEIN